MCGEKWERSFQAQQKSLFFAVKMPFSSCSFVAVCLAQLSCVNAVQLVNKILKLFLLVLLKCSDFPLFSYLGSGGMTNGVHGKHCMRWKKENLTKQESSQAWERAVSMKQGERTNGKKCWLLHCTSHFLPGRGQPLEPLPSNPEHCRVTIHSHSSSCRKK